MIISRIHCHATIISPVKNVPISLSRRNFNPIQTGLFFDLLDRGGSGSPPYLTPKIQEYSSETLRMYSTSEIVSFEVRIMN